MKWKKKNTVLFAISILIVFMAFILHSYNIEAKKSENIKSIDKYVVIGDFLTLESKNEFNINYTKLIYEFFKSLNPDLTYENLSENNMDINKLVNIINEKESSLEDSDLIVLTIGESIILNSINNSLVKNDDLLSSDKEEISNYIDGIKLESDILEEIEEFKINFLKVILKIKELAPQAEIYVNNLYNPINEKEDIYYFIEGKVNEINNLIYENQSKNLYKVIDSYTTFKNNNLHSLKYDLNGIRSEINNNGHAILASELIKDYEQYVYLDINKITEKSTKIVGYTIPNSRMIALSENRVIGTAEVDKNGYFDMSISSLYRDNKIDILIYDKQLFSILYASKQIIVK